MPSDGDPSQSGIREQLAELLARLDALERRVDALAPSANTGAKEEGENGITAEPGIRAFLRWQALLLLAFSIGKVFLADAGFLTQGYRVLSFLVLGVLLLAISFAYQKDWLALRESRK